MSTHDILHLIAVGLTAMTVCVHPGWRRRTSSPGLVAAILMLAAMADAMFVNLLGVVVWTPLLLAGAIALAAARSGRRQTPQTSGRGVSATSHDPLGLVATAALLPFMHASSTAVSDHAGHGVGSGVLIAVVLLVAAGHVVGALVACVRTSGAWSRIRFVVMGVATAFMATSAMA